MIFWDQKTETIERAALEALQLKRLQATVRRVARKVPLYQQKLAGSGVKPRQVQSLADLRRLPFTTNADLRDAYPPGCSPSRPRTCCDCTRPVVPRANQRRCSSRAGTWTTPAS